MLETSSSPTSEGTLSAALEDAEGRALVEEILERKRLRNIRERFFQQIVWGDVHTDGHGNVIPRELPGYWKALKTAMVSGAGVEYTKAKMMTHETGWRVGGRASGKVSAQIEGTREAIGWLDEHVRFLVEQYRDPHLQVREVVTRYELTPVALTVPAVGPVRWACTSPTGEPPVDRMAERWADFTRGMADGLAGRAYAETRQEARLRDIITDPRSGVRA